VHVREVGDESRDRNFCFPSILHQTNGQDIYGLHYPAFLGIKFLMKREVHLNFLKLIKNCSGILKETTTKIRECGTFDVLVKPSTDKPINSVREDVGMLQIPVFSSSEMKPDPAFPVSLQPPAHSPEYWKAVLVIC
jgi:hypothetical protein